MIMRLIIISCLPVLLSAQHLIEPVAFFSTSELENPNTVVDSRGNRYVWFNLIPGEEISLQDTLLHAASEMEVLIIKQFPDGTVAWDSTFDYHSVHRIAIDRQDNIYIAGLIKDEDPYFYLSMIDSDGDLRWTFSDRSRFISHDMLPGDDGVFILGEWLGSADDSVFGIAVDRTVQGNDILLKISNNGPMDWVTPGIPPSNTKNYALKWDNRGNLIFTSIYRGSYDITDDSFNGPFNDDQITYIVSVDPVTGARNWISSIDRPRFIISDFEVVNDSMYLGGFYKENADDEHFKAFLARADTMGRISHITEMTNPGNSRIEYLYQHQGNVYFTGLSEGTFTLGDITLTNDYDSSFPFIGKISQDTITWIRSFNPVSNRVIESGRFKYGYALTFLGDIPLLHGNFSKALNTVHDTLVTSDERKHFFQALLLENCDSSQAEIVREVSDLSLCAGQSLAFDRNLSADPEFWKIREGNAGDTLFTEDQLIFSSVPAGILQLENIQYFCLQKQIRTLTVNTLENPDPPELAPYYPFCDSLVLTTAVPVELYEEPGGALLNTSVTSLTTFDSDTLYFSVRNGGCESELIQVVAEKLASPSPPIVPVDTLFGCGPEAMLSIEGDSIAWYEDLQDTVPVASANIFSFSTEREGIYTYYAARLQDGCESNRVPVSFVRQVNPLKLALPNLITLNGDGKNDHFHIPIEENSCTGAFVGFQVVNRWGERLYETNDPRFRWYPERSGIYFYQLSYELQDVRGDILVVD